MNQYFLKLSPRHSLVNCGIVDINESNAKLNYYVKDAKLDVFEAKEALEYLNHRILEENITKNPKVIFFIHGFWGSLPFTLFRTSRAFQRYYFKSKESNISSIVHIIWDASDINYSQSVFKIAKTKAVLASIFNEINLCFKTRSSLMCHSMGNRFLFETLNSQEVNVQFEELLLIAPDLDFKLFEKFPFLFTKLSNRVIVFYHTKDKTLKLSSFLNRAERLGRLKAADETQQIDFVDFTTLNDIKSIPDSVLRHLYFITSKTVTEKIESIFEN